MDDNEIAKQADSFINDTPCKSLKIPDCEKLKERYKNQLANKGKGCSKCRKNGLRKKFKNKIVQILKDAG